MSATAGSPQAIRRRGHVASAVGLGASGHACWGFKGQSSFHRAALDFLADGQRMGQRLLYFSNERREDQRAVLAPLGDVDRLVERGELRLVHVGEIYDLSHPIDPKVQLAGYAAQTDQALCDGYTGLRVAAEASALVADPARREAHVRWESIADSYMAEHPLAALCAYDENTVPDELLADLRCVHPACDDRHRQLPFRLAYLDADTLALEGEVDTFSAKDLERLLRITLAESDGAIDLQALHFIDHRGLIALANYSSEHAIPLTRMPPIARRLCELLQLAVCQA
jgi:anti-anti-sigma regulatory factor